MWVAAAYNNWLHVGSYCATFKHKIGAKVKKNDERYYNAYKQMPFGDIGQLYILDQQNNKPPRGMTEKRLGKFLRKVEKGVEDDDIN